MSDKSVATLTRFLVETKISPRRREQILSPELCRLFPSNLILVRMIIHAKLILVLLNELRTGEKGKSYFALRFNMFSKMGFSFAFSA